MTMGDGLHPMYATHLDWVVHHKGEVRIGSDFWTHLDSQESWTLHGTFVMARRNTVQGSWQCGCEAALAHLEA